MFQRCVETTFEICQEMTMELEYSIGMIKRGRIVVDGTLTIPMFYF